MLIEALDRGNEQGGQCLAAGISSTHHQQDLDAPIHKQEQFLELLSSLSSEFISINADRLDARIEARLHDLANCIGVERVLLVEFQSDQLVCVTHSYAAHEASLSLPFDLDHKLPCFAAMVRDGRIIRLERRADLPEEAVNERRWMQANGIEASLTIPCPASGRPLCAIMLASHRERPWPDQLVSQLRLTGEVFANVLARKVADARLHQTRDQLAHLVRVSTVGQLATSIAHEINQPLCAVMSNAQAALELLSANPPDVDETRAALNDIIHDAKRAGEVIARSHTMLKRRSDDHMRQDLKRIVNEVKLLVANYAAIRRVRLELSPGDVPPVLGCGVQIQQVITNLVVNAIDAISPDQFPPGRVCISTHGDTGAREVVVRVKDNGNGIAPEAAAHIFDPFYTTKINGLGMGLSIARALVDAHGGRIWMEPNADRGMTFAFSLPATIEDQP